MNPTEAANLNDGFLNQMSPTPTEVVELIVADDNCSI